MNFEISHWTTTCIIYIDARFFYYDVSRNINDLARNLTVEYVFLNMVLIIIQETVKGKT